MQQCVESFTHVSKKKSKPPQSLRLVELILKKYCISRTEATNVILEIKRQNGGVLKGLKCRVFFKMAGRLIRTVQLKKKRMKRFFFIFFYDIFKGGFLSGFHGGLFQVFRWNYFRFSGGIV